MAKDNAILTCFKCGATKETILLPIYHKTGGTMGLVCSCPKCLEFVVDNNFNVNFTVGEQEYRDEFEDDFEFNDMDVN